MKKTGRGKPVSLLNLLMFVDDNDDRASMMMPIRSKHDAAKMRDEDVFSNPQILAVHRSSFSAMKLSLYGCKGLLLAHCYPTHQNHVKLVPRPVLPPTPHYESSEFSEEDINPINVDSCSSGSSSD